MPPRFAPAPEGVARQWRSFVRTEIASSHHQIGRLT